MRVEQFDLGAAGRGAGAQPQPDLALVGWADLAEEQAHPAPVDLRRASEGLDHLDAGAEVEFKVDVAGDDLLQGQLFFEEVLLHLIAGLDKAVVAA